MKTILLCGLALSLSAFGGTSYAPNDGTARPGNPGVAPVKTTDVTAIDDEKTMESSTLEKTNTSPNPIPADTTLQGKTLGNKQSQESDEEELDYRAIPKVDHSDGEGEPTENQ